MTTTAPAPATKRLESPARRLIAFSLKIKGKSRLSPALTEELNEIARDSARYLNQRRSSVEALSSKGKAATDTVAKLEKQIASLEKKDEKSEADYQRLSTLERMLLDFRGQVEKSEAKFQDADALLNAEIAEWRHPLISALGINFFSDIVAEATEAVKPFCAEMDPLPIVRQLPTVSRSMAPFQLAYDRFQSGLTNAKAICDLIEKVIGEKIK